MPEALFATIHKEKLVTWSREKIKQVVKQSGFYNSGVISYTIKTGELIITNKTGPLPDLASNNNHHHTLTTATYIADPAKDIINLTQVYTTDQKYRGQSNNFDLKLTIFQNHCHQLSITNNTIKAKAYSTMLKDEALTHFFTNTNNLGSSNLLTHIAPSFQELCHCTQSYFKNKEYQRAQLQLFNSLTLRQVIENSANNGKTTKECFAILLSELRRLQAGLDALLRVDSLLHNRLILACQDQAACSYVCFKLSPTIPGLVNNLQSSIDTYEKTYTAQLTPTYLADTDEPAAYYTDHKFYRNDRGGS
jgi:hypothetical protein